MGGQQRRMAQIANALAQGARHRDAIHHIVSLNGDISAASLLREGGVPFETTALDPSPSSPLGVMRIKTLIEVLRKSAPTVVCTYNWGGIEGVLANRASLRAPHIHYEDGFGPDENPNEQKTRRVLARRLLLSGTTIVVPSRTLERVARSVWRLPEENVRFIANGVDIARFSGDVRTDADNDADKDADGGTVIGAVGALRAEKNHVALLRAAASLKIKAAVEIVGDGPLRDPLRALCVSSGLDPAAVLTGETTAPEEAYRRFDIFCLPSTTEQMPLSLLEAMAAGLPAVASDVGDVKEMVAAENHPFITPPGDDQALIAALRALADDRELRQRIGRANAVKARRDYALDQMTDAHLDLITPMAKPPG